LKVPKGCAICESTWGNNWAEVEGQKMFFCCEICEVEFRNMIEEVKRRTGWKTIDEIRITGDQKGRECTALLGPQAFRYFIRFSSQGAIDTFRQM
jgi:YHS domain-containing protein